jgi:hypothetical protein
LCYCLSDCPSISSLGSELSVICQSAFSGCSSLASICIPSTATIVSNHGFPFCGSLGCVIFVSVRPLKEFYDFAFVNCSVGFHIDFDSVIRHIPGCRLFYGRNSVSELRFGSGSKLQRPSFGQSRNQITSGNRSIEQVGIEMTQSKPFREGMRYFSAQGRRMSEMRGRG